MYIVECREIIVVCKIKEFVLSEYDSTEAFNGKLEYGKPKGGEIE